MPLLATGLHRAGVGLVVVTPRRVGIQHAVFRVRQRDAPRHVLRPDLAFRLRQRDLPLGDGLACRCRERRQLLRDGRQFCGDAEFGVGGRGAE